VRALSCYCGVFFACPSERSEESPAVVEDDQTGGGKAREDGFDFFPCGGILWPERIPCPSNMNKGMNLAKAMEGDVGACLRARPGNYE